MIKRREFIAGLGTVTACSRAAHAMPWRLADRGNRRVFYP
jgi:hypothetical protein